mmetsp:Transcript_1325/g.3265  ORF Transcript_1325/g.3265 Transcript_1325/m.3265 type:complete len:125 (-) Transcript_1325:56-430(-)
MDDWTMYQLTADPAYIAAFRRKTAFRAGMMGGSLAGIGVACTAMMMADLKASSRPGAPWLPKKLPKRIAASVVLGFSVCFGFSWLRSRELVGMFLIAPPPGGEEAEASPPRVASATSGGAARTI